MAADLDGDVITTVFALDDDGAGAFPLMPVGQAVDMGHAPDGTPLLDPRLFDTVEFQRNPYPYLPAGTPVFAKAVFGAADQPDLQTASAGGGRGLCAALSRAGLHVAPGGARITVARRDAGLPWESQAF